MVRETFRKWPQFGILVWLSNFRDQCELIHEHQLHRRNQSMASCEMVRQIALSTPNVNQRPSYGTPAFFVKRKLFARLLDEGDSVVVKIDDYDRKRRMNADPKTLFVTDHYQNDPTMIVCLSGVTEERRGFDHSSMRSPAVCVCFPRLRPDIIVRSKYCGLRC